MIIDKKEKKYLIIRRNGCISCGACMVASNHKCYFLDGKSWCVKEPIENCDDVVDVCPTNVIETATLEEYEVVENELIKEGILKK